MEKKILLFSGGFDSMLQEFLLKPDILLYVDMKTSYSEREIEYLKTLPKNYTDRLIVKELPLGEYENEDKYLPYRNLILGTIAMEYGQHVYFGFDKADVAPDNDMIFLQKLNSIFRHLNVHAMGDMGWGNFHFSFNAPFKKYTKTDLVRKCLSKGMDKGFIRNIRTCYDGISKKGCGLCTPCRRKAIALINNGISIKGLFDTEPTLEFFEKTLQDMEEEGDDKNVIGEYRQAIQILKKER
jgi:7-cyano-7-deazaguanine synthase in queuosine biosynthesis